MSKIQWTGTTWNPIIGCTKVSPGCKNCYAERMAARLVRMGQDRYRNVIDTSIWRWNGTTHLSNDILTRPLRWRKPRRVFVNSMSDLFHESISFEDIATVFGVMATTPQHTYQVLTKRPARMAAWFEWADTFEIDDGGTGPARAMWQSLCCSYADFPKCWEGEDGPPMPGDWPLLNIHILVSIENQETADERIPLLLQVPSVVRGVSVEPLLEFIDLECIVSSENGGRYDALRGGMTGGLPCDTGGPRLSWVIAGGESGPHSRPCDIEWSRFIVSQCRDAGVPCFVKQLGSKPISCDTPLRLRHRSGGDPSEWPSDLRVRQWPVDPTDSRGNP